MLEDVLRLKPFLLTGCGVIGLFAIGSTSVRADDHRLQAQITEMQGELRDLQREVARAQAEAAAASAAASSKSESDLDLKVKWKGAPEFSSADGKYKMKVRGRIHTDAEHIDQDDAVTGEPDINGAEIRRARLGVEGVVVYDVAYKLEVDFAGDEVALKDAYLMYTGLPVDAAFGHFKTYNSLEELTSANYITFMERAAFIDAFTLDRQIGFGLSHEAEQWTASAGVFSTAPVEQQSDFFNSGATFSGRLTAAPINHDDRVLHLGISARHRDAPGPARDGATENLFSYSARGADFHLADRFVDTGDIGAADTFWGLEAAWVWGAFSLQAEYTQNKVDVANDIASVDPTYAGWYVDASFFLTGESRPYDEGVFGRIKVKNPVIGGAGWGAWQIAARYDVIDLSDGADAIAAAGVVDCAECGEQRTWLIGVNWHLNNYTRLMLNVNQSKIDNGVNNDAEITGVGARAQVDW